MSRQNEELLKNIPMQRRNGKGSRKLKELGILKASPWMARELPVESSPVYAHIAQQDPAIIGANYQMPSPSSSVHSSIPSLELHSKVYMKIQILIVLLQGTHPQRKECSGENRT